MRCTLSASIVVAILLFHGKPADAADSTDPVKAYLEWQNGLSRISLQFETEIAVKGGHPSRPKNTRAEGTLRRDGNRIDLQTRHLVGGTTGQRKPTTRSRAIVSDGHCLSYETHHSVRVLPDLGVFAKDTGEMHTAIYTSAALDGFFPGTDGKSVADLLGSRGATVRVGSIESIRGERCRLVSATTRYGDLTLWLAVERMYAPLQIRYVKKSFDRWKGYKSLSESTFDDGPASAWTAVLSNVILSKIGDTYIPVGGRLSLRSDLTNGGTVTHSARYWRRNVSVEPDFTRDREAFVFDLPDGTEIRNELSPEAGKQFVWRRDGVREGKPSPATSAAGDLWWLIDWGLIGLDAIIVFAIVRMLWRARALRKGRRATSAAGTQ